MRSPLDFGNSESFRNLLITKNLAPYKKTPHGKSPPFNYEVSPFATILNVVDSPDKLIDEPIFAKGAYVLNKYGAYGGYIQTRDVNVLNNNKTNYGEYGLKNSVALKINRKSLNDNLFENFYTTKDDLTDSAIYIENDDKWFDANLPKKGILYYWGVGDNSFTPSMYTPFGILTNNAETKSNLSADSYIARLGAEVLTEYFIDRVGRLSIKFDNFKKFEQTIASLNDPFDVYNIITGPNPIIQPNWSITKPNNLLVAASQLALELVGAELPFPTIVGSYFDESISLTGKGNKGFLGGLFQQKKTGSQLFYDNMGAGQRSVLYKNINKNLYKPNYERSGILGSFLDLFTNNKGAYYIGNDNLDIIDILSPEGDLPIDQFGRRIQKSVYSSTEVSKVYEGETFNPAIGFNGKSDIDGGGIEGGLTWVSPKYKNNAGKNAGKGGEIFGDNGTKQTTFDGTESTNYDFKNGSILDDTQRIINSQPNGANRLKHVGNAMDQVSKVFNDGYKEITKGSRVKTYKYQNPETLVGGSFQEYCRLFTKDSPYMTYERLQKTSGITNEGRRLKGSVINKTYDLSIAPKKGNDSKKYMLSIENLAWRTTNKFLDLPECEKGPNGGRLMWFPPYDLKVTDSSSSTWNSNEFLGRPEPVFTYKNTTRTGSLEFSIVVDHPSVLNLITNRILEKENNSEVINGILSSFFAGCLKYDIYDLAKIYNTMTLSELEEIQKIVKESSSVKDDVSYIKRTVVTNVDPINPSQVDTPPDKTDTRFDKYKEYAFYFDNDVPKSSNADYVSAFNSYTASPLYNQAQLKSFMDLYVKDNFAYLNKFVTECNEFLAQNEGNTIELTLNSSASKPASITYNKALSQRRSSSVTTYLTNNIKSKNFTIKTNILGEETGVVANTTTGGTKSVPNCSDFTENAITSVPAMACRRVAIKDVKAIQKGVAPKVEPTLVTNESEVKVTKQKIEKEITTTENKLYKNVSKRVLQKLLTECDYFETIEETDPFIYNNLKEKLKYFSPAFHSTTPEGLNGRLTFLQQCVRPGDTIPTIREGEVKEFKDARNTAFGVPPVLVLRVGDFFHTKIIPDNLTISYDPLHWDINPEGIGLQPMIAKVNLSFKFVGASGLSNAVDKLQNALSFNYYANTEVYDARADKTDNSLDDMDVKILDFIREKEKGKTENFDDVKVVNAYKTIGEIDTTATTLNYITLATELVEASTAYVNTINSAIQENSKAYNIELVSLILKSLNNVNGVYNPTTLGEFKLLGVPTDYQKTIDDYVKTIKDSIKNNSDGFIEQINEEFSSEKSIKFDVSNNYQLYVDNEMVKVNNNINILTKAILDAQEKYQKVLSKALFVISTHNSYLGHDGYVDKTGNFFVFKLINSLTGIQDVLSGIAEHIETDFLPYLKINLYNPKDIFSSDQDSLIYLLLYGAFRDKNGLENFEKQILLKSINPDKNFTSNNEKISKIFKSYWGEKLIRYNNKYKEETINFLTDLTKYTNDIVISLKAIKPNGTAGYISGYEVIESPDNETKTAILTLNGVDNYDNNKTTWNKNSNGFILVKNKLMR
jgi:hypothetical protein